MSALVALDRPHEGVARVTLSDPARRNHGTFQAVAELADALAEAREGGARVTVLASAVPGHWIEHAWLPDLLALVRGESPTGDPGGWFRVLRELGDASVVSIAALSGDCSGGGAELAWACDLRVAEAGVVCSQPEVQVGLTPGIGGASRLLRLVGRTVAAEMVLDGGPVPAERLYAVGGINRLVAAGAAQKEALAWAARLARRPPAALAHAKRVLTESEAQGWPEALRNEQARFQEILATPAAQAEMERAQPAIDQGRAPRDLYRDED
ncbi:MAG: enoyl-CoA hydratase/isomerase family protein [Proteobacteria bacterium]|nr:enoyl-CoA hydratase/isomerase family protein [Pseudomonadota bacterium]